MSTTIDLNVSSSATPKCFITLKYASITSHIELTTNDIFRPSTSVSLSYFSYKFRIKGIKYPSSCFSKYMYAILLINILRLKFNVYKQAPCIFSKNV